MLKVIPLRLLSSLLLTLFLLLTIDGACQNARAALAHTSELGCQVPVADAAAPCDCPGTPGEHEDAPGHCDDCDGCGCGASLFGHLFRYVYHPVTTALSFLDHTRFIPEVYLPRFTQPPDLV